LDALEVASGSAINRLSSLETASGSAISRLSSLETASGSAITRLSSLETASGSAITRLSALEVASGSAITRLSSLEIASGSAISRLNSLEVTSGSNITRLTNLENKTGSYATTGSNTFIGSQTITGSIFGSGSLTINGCITSTGQIVAQTINVQQVTSSIVYSCGSNNFGTSTSNSQTFTGSMFITGSNIVANVNNTCFSGNVCIGGGLVAQQPSTFCDTVGLFGNTAQLYIGATNGASNYTILKWCTTDKSLNIHNQSTGGTPQLVIACNGNVGVKTIASPNYDLEVRGNIGVISSTSAGLITTSTLCAAGTITGLIRFDGLHTPSLTTYTGPSINACKDDANYATSLVFKTTDGSGGNNVNLRITGAGVANFSSRVNINGAPDDADIAMVVKAPSGSSKFIMFGRNASDIAVFRISNAGETTANQFISCATDNGSGEYYFIKGNAAVSNNFSIYAYSNILYYNSYSSMYFRANNTGGSGGDIIFSGGNVGIGTTSPGKIFNVAANDTTSGNYQARSAVIRIQNTNDVGANSRFAGVQFSFSPGASTGDNYVIGAVGAVLTDSSTQWSGDLVFAVKNATTATTLTEYMRIATGGNVGIGTISPQSQLHIYNNSAGATFRLHGTRTADGEVGVINFSNITDITGGYIIGSIAVNRSGFDNGGAMIFSTATAASTPTERIRITNTGVLGFNGSSGPANASVDKMSMGYLNSGYGWIQTWNSTPLVLNREGNNVGIGTCAPNAKLTVWTPSTTGLQTALRLNNPFGFDNLNTGAQIVFSQDRSVAEDLKQGIIAVGQQDAGTSATSFMAFYTNNTGLGERLRITSTGVACFSSTICAPMASISGCIGIGTNPATYTLKAAGRGYFFATNQDAGWGMLTLDYGNGVNGSIYAIQMAEGGAINAAVGYGSYASSNCGDLVMWTNDGGGLVERSRMYSNGAARIATMNANSTTVLQKSFSVAAGACVNVCFDIFNDIPGKGSGYVFQADINIGGYGSAGASSLLYKASVAGYDGHHVGIGSYHQSSEQVKCASGVDIKIYNPPGCSCLLGVTIYNCSGTYVHVGTFRMVLTY
jgi:hypothetical protein